MLLLLNLLRVHLVQFGQHLLLLFLKETRHTLLHLLLLVSLDFGQFFLFFELYEVLFSRGWVRSSAVVCNLSNGGQTFAAFDPTFVNF